MKTSQILQTAEKLVSTDRSKTHGDKKVNHQNIASLWSAYLDFNISPKDVAILMVLLKLARTKTGQHYSAIAGELND